MYVKLTYAAVGALAVGALLCLPMQSWAQDPTGAPSAPQFASTIAVVDSQYRVHEALQLGGLVPIGTPAFPAWLQQDISAVNSRGLPATGELLPASQSSPRTVEARFLAITDNDKGVHLILDLRFNPILPNWLQSVVNAVNNGEPTRILGVMLTTAEPHFPMPSSGSRG